MGEARLERGRQVDRSTQTNLLVVEIQPELVNPNMRNTGHISQLSRFYRYFFANSASWHNSFKLTIVKPFFVF